QLVQVSYPTSRQPQPMLQDIGSRCEAMIDSVRGRALLCCEAFRGVGERYGATDSNAGLVPISGGIEYERVHLGAREPTEVHPRRDRSIAPRRRDLRLDHGGLGQVGVVGENDASRRMVEVHVCKVSPVRGVAVAAGVSTNCFAS